MKDVTFFGTSISSFLIKKVWKKISSRHDINIITRSHGLTTSCKTPTNGDNYAAHYNVAVYTNEVPYIPTTTTKGFSSVLAMIYYGTLSTYSMFKLRESVSNISLAPCSRSLCSRASSAFVFAAAYS